MKRCNIIDNEEVPKQKQKLDNSTNEDNEAEKNSHEQSLTTREMEYIQQLYNEKSKLNPSAHSNAVRLLDQEISKVQSSGRIPQREYKYVNIYREKPIKLTTKVLIPVQEHPKFNFVGKLLGPKGNSLKRLQEETMCKMAILGKGSMRDPIKEQELQKSTDPKHAHLMEELHVEVSAFGPPAEAYARMAFALAEIRKYLIPEKNDLIRQEQLRELESLGGAYKETSRDYSEAEMVKHPPRAPPRPTQMRTATRAPVMTPRVMPAKTKIMSILDKARVALEESYGNDEPMSDYGHHFGGFDDPNMQNNRYEEPEYFPQGYQRKNFNNMRDGPGQHWRKGPTRMPVRPYENSTYRSDAYPRSSSKGNY